MSHSPTLDNALPTRRDEDARNAWVALVVRCTAVFMLLDTTIVTHAQVKIRQGLDAVLEAVRGGFTDGVRNTFVSGALVCLPAAAAAFVLRDPVRRQETAPARAADSAIATAG